MPDDIHDAQAQILLQGVDLGDWSVLISDTADDLAQLYGDGLAEGLRLTDISVDLDQVHQRALEWARERAASLVTQIEDNTRDMLRSTVAEAIEQGWSADRLAEEIAQSAGFSEDRAQMIARTECLVGETPISAAVIRAVFRRWYHGQVVEIITAKGRQFAATPNHPMLTRRGWIGAGKITKADYLICDTRQERLCAHRDEDIDRTPTVLYELFDAFAVTGSFERRPSNRFDFHGDGGQCDIEVARCDRELHLGSFAPLYKPVVEDFLTPSYDMGHTAFCPFCGRLLSIDKRISLVCRTESYSSFPQTRDNALGTAEAVCERENISGCAGLIQSNEFTYRDVLAIGGRASSGEAAFRGVRLRSQNTGVSCEIADITRVKPGFDGNGLTTEAGFIEFDRVISISLRPYAGHVFNLETPFGYFTIADGVYSGNTIAANNQGNLAGYKEAARQGVSTLKEWLLGDDPCEICEDNADDGAIGLDEDFSSGDDAPPAHPRCVCAVAPVLAEDDEEEEE